jgi:CBS domain-containing protein
MATLRDLLSLKGRNVVSVRPTDTVLQAATLMNERTIGAVVVLEGDQLAGIFTERDVLRRVVAPGLDPAVTPVSTVMSTMVVTCQPDLSLEDCAALMTNRGIRHLPVRDQSGLAGMISIRDLLAHKVGEQEATIEQMNHYLFDVR